MSPNKTRAAAKKGRVNRMEDNNGNGNGKKTPRRKVVASKAQTKALQKTPTPRQPKQLEWKQFMDNQAVINETILAKLQEKGQHNVPDKSGQIHNDAGVGGGGGSLV